MSLQCCAPCGRHLEDREFVNEDGKVLKTCTKCRDKRSQRKKRATIKRRQEKHMQSNMNMNMVAAPQALHQAGYEQHYIHDAGAAWPAQPANATAAASTFGIITEYAPSLRAASGALSHQSRLARSLVRPSIKGSGNDTNTTPPKLLRRHSHLPQSDEGEEQEEDKEKDKT